MSEQQRHQQSRGRRGQVLQLLRDGNEALGVTEIADRLGIHANTARFHLETLLDNRQVERTRAGGGTPGRPAQLFRAVRGMDPMGTRRYRVLAEALVAMVAADPDPGGRAVEAGRRWGRRQAATDIDPAASAGLGVALPVSGSVDRLLAMLDELGFAPEKNLDEQPTQIGLRSCPFLELAVDHADVVCSLHLGLMRGAMESWGSPVDVTRLDPFVTPDRCRVSLSVATS